MLSRTAEGLFWMGRYIERMENVARLLETGMRLDNLPRQHAEQQSEWTSVVIASGATQTFPAELESADRESVTDHLIRDRDNPSSIASCIEGARMNAKAVRNAITADVWEAVNDARAEMLRHLADGNDRRNLARFVDWVKDRSGLAHGKIYNTMLRTDEFHFLELGKWFERADATARLLDVKYHVLLPDATDVGGGLDYMQWVQILRASNSSVAFRHLYSRIVDARGVVDLLVLNTKSPRSLITSFNSIASTLDHLASDLPVQQTLAQKAHGAATQLRGTTTDHIFDQGLHDWLTDFIVNTNILALETSSAFGFGHEVALDTGAAPQ